MMYKYDMCIKYIYAGTVILKIIENNII